MSLLSLSLYIMDTFVPVALPHQERVGLLHAHVLLDLFSLDESSRVFHLNKGKSADLKSSPLSAEHL